MGEGERVNEREKETDKQTGRQTETENEKKILIKGAQGERFIFCKQKRLICYKRYRGFQNKKIKKKSIFF